MIIFLDKKSIYIAFVEYNLGYSSLIKINKEVHELFPK